MSYKYKMDLGKSRKASVPSAASTTRCIASSSISSSSTTKGVQKLYTKIRHKFEDLPPKISAKLHKTSKHSSTSNSSSPAGKFTPLNASAKSKSTTSQNQRFVTKSVQTSPIKDTHQNFTQGNMQKNEKSIAQASQYEKRKVVSGNPKGTNTLVYEDSDEECRLTINESKASLEDEIFKELEKVAHDEAKLNAVLKNFDKILNDFNQQKVDGDCRSLNISLPPPAKFSDIPSPKKLQKSKTCSIIESRCILKKSVTKSEQNADSVSIGLQSQNVFNITKSLWNLKDFEEFAKSGSKLDKLTQYTNLNKSDGKIQVSANECRPKAKASTKPMALRSKSVWELSENNQSVTTSRSKIPIMKSSSIRSLNTRSNSFCDVQNTYSPHTVTKIVKNLNESSAKPFNRAISSLAVSTGKISYTPNGGQRPRSLAAAVSTPHSLNRIGHTNANKSSTPKFTTKPGSSELLNKKSTTNNRFMPAVKSNSSDILLDKCLEKGHEILRKVEAFGSVTKFDPKRKSSTVVNAAKKTRPVSPRNEVKVKEQTTSCTWKQTNLRHSPGKAVPKTSTTKIESNTTPNSRRSGDKSSCFTANTYSHSQPEVGIDITEDSNICRSNIDPSPSSKTDSSDFRNSVTNPDGGPFTRSCGSANLKTNLNVKSTAGSDENSNACANSGLNPKASLRVTANSGINTNLKANLNSRTEVNSNCVSSANSNQSTNLDSNPNNDMILNANSNSDTNINSDFAQHLGISNSNSTSKNISDYNEKSTTNAVVGNFNLNNSNSTVNTVSDCKAKSNFNEIYSSSSNSNLIKNVLSNSTNNTIPSSNFNSDISTSSGFEANSNVNTNSNITVDTNSNNKTHTELKTICNDQKVSDTNGVSDLNVNSGPTANSDINNISSTGTNKDINANTNSNINTDLDRIPNPFKIWGCTINSGLNKYTFTKPNSGTKINVGITTSSDPKTHLHSKKNSASTINSHFATNSDSGMNAVSEIHSVSKGNSGSTTSSGIDKNSNLKTNLCSEVNTDSKANSDSRRNVHSTTISETNEDSKRNSEVDANLQFKTNSDLQVHLDSNLNSHSKTNSCYSTNWDSKANSNFISNSGFKSHLNSHKKSCLKINSGHGTNLDNTNGDLKKNSNSNSKSAKLDLKANLDLKTSSETVTYAEFKKYSKLETNSDSNINSAKLDLKTNSDFRTVPDSEINPDFKTNSDSNTNSAKFDIKTNSNFMTNSDIKTNLDSSIKSSKLDLKTNSDSRIVPDFKTNSDLKTYSNSNTNSTKFDVKTNSNTKTNSDLKINSDLNRNSAKSNLKTNSDIKANSDIIKNLDVNSNSTKLDLKTNSDIKTVPDFKTNLDSNTNSAKFDIKTNSDFKTNADFKMNSKLKTNSDRNANFSKFDVKTHLDFKSDFKMNSNLEINSGSNANSTKSNLKTNSDFKTVPDFKTNFHSNVNSTKSNLRTNSDLQPDFETNSNLEINSGSNTNSTKSNIKPNSDLKTVPAFKTNSDSHVNSTKSNLKTNSDFKSDSKINSNLELNSGPIVNSTKSNIKPNSDLKTVTDFKTNSDSHVNSTKSNLKTNVDFKPNFKTNSNLETNSGSNANSSKPHHKSNSYFIIMPDSNQILTTNACLSKNERLNTVSTLQERLSPFKEHSGIKTHLGFIANADSKPESGSSTSLDFTGKSLGNSISRDVNPQSSSSLSLYAHVSKKDDEITGSSTHSNSHARCTTPPVPKMLSSCNRILDSSSTSDTTNTKVWPRSNVSLVTSESPFRYPSYGPDSRSSIEAITDSCRVSDCYGEAECNAYFSSSFSAISSIKTDSSVCLGQNSNPQGYPNPVTKSNFNENSNLKSCLNPDGDVDPNLGLVFNSARIVEFNAELSSDGSQCTNTSLQSKLDAGSKGSPDINPDPSFKLHPKTGLEECFDSDTNSTNSKLNLKFKGNGALNPTPGVESSLHFNANLRDCKPKMSLNCTATQNSNSCQTCKASQAFNGRLTSNSYLTHCGPNSIERRISNGTMVCIANSMINTAIDEANIRPNSNASINSHETASLNAGFHIKESPACNGTLPSNSDLYCGGNDMLNSQKLLTSSTVPTLDEKLNSKEMLNSNEVLDENMFSNEKLNSNSLLYCANTNLSIINLGSTINTATSPSSKGNTVNTGNSNCKRSSKLHAKAKMEFTQNSSKTRLYSSMSSNANALSNPNWEEPMRLYSIDFSDPQECAGSAQTIADSKENEPINLVYAKEVTVKYPRLESCKIIPPILGITSEEHAELLVTVKTAPLHNTTTSTKTTATVATTSAAISIAHQKQSYVDSDHDSDDSGHISNENDDIPTISGGGDSGNISNTSCKEASPPPHELQHQRALPSVKISELLQKYEQNNVHQRQQHDQHYQDHLFQQYKKHQKQQQLDPKQNAPKKICTATKVTEVEPITCIRTHLEIYPTYSKEVILRLL